MEELDLDRVRAAYAAFSEGGEAPDRDLFDPDMEFHNAPELPGATVHRGYDAMIADVKSQGEIWEGRIFEPVDIVEAGDRILVLLMVNARGKSSGVPVRQEISHVITHRDGKVVRVQAFLDRERALREAGVERR